MAADLDLPALLARLRSGSASLERTWYLDGIPVPANHEAADLINEAIAALLALQAQRDEAVRQLDKATEAFADALRERLGICPSVAPVGDVHCTQPRDHELHRAVTTSGVEITWPPERGSRLDC